MKSNSRFLKIYRQFFNINSRYHDIMMKDFITSDQDTRYALLMTICAGSNNIDLIKDIYINFIKNISDDELLYKFINSIYYNKNMENFVNLFLDKDILAINYNIIDKIRFSGTPDIIYTIYGSSYFYNALSSYGIDHDDFNGSTAFKYFVKVILGENYGNV